MQKEAIKLRTKKGDEPGRGRARGEGSCAIHQGSIFDEALGHPPMLEYIEIGCTAWPALLYAKGPWCGWGSGVLLLLFSSSDSPEGPSERGLLAPSPAAVGPPKFSMLDWGCGIGVGIGDCLGFGLLPSAMKLPTTTWKTIVQLGF
nr:hypothetical protein Itr_chr15CG01800 [Ipomoea trifida]